MRTSDLWLILLGLLVLGLTAGTLAYMEANDDRVRVAFVESESPLAETSADGVGPGGARLNWTLPANATAARVTLLLSFEGQAVQGGSATVQTQLFAPDGTAGSINRTVFSIAPGATSGQTTVELELRWLEPPRNTTADLDGFDRSRAWNEPLTLLILVQPPGDLPVASYSFMARASGTATVYAHEV